MKKILLLILCCGFYAVSSAAVGVSSANINGSARIELPENDFALVSCSFINKSNTIDNLFSDLPEGTMLSLWDVESQTYENYYKTDRWLPSGTNRVEAGDGIFVRLPPDAPASNLVMSGDVPLEETITVFSPAGFVLMSYPYPHKVPFPETELAKKAAIGDKISVWEDNGWSTYECSAAGRWDGAENVKLKIGQAFFYKSSVDSYPVEARPFAITNPE